MNYEDTLNESIDYVLDLLEHNGYELSTENVLALCENIENNDTYVLLDSEISLNEWTDPDFYYMQILENNNFELTENNVNVLKEAIANGTIILAETGKPEDSSTPPTAQRYAQTDDTERAHATNSGDNAAYNAQMRTTYNTARRDAKKAQFKGAVKGGLIGAGVGGAVGAGAGAGIAAKHGLNVAKGTGIGAQAGLMTGLAAGIAGGIIKNRIQKHREQEDKYNKAVMNAHNAKTAADREKFEAQAAGYEALGARERQEKYMKDHVNNMNSNSSGRAPVNATIPTEPTK